ncbi:MAG: hypothetical protein WKF37_10340 [Bryobacteraceae bacterium]
MGGFEETLQKTGRPFRWLRVPNFDFLHESSAIQQLPGEPLVNIDGGDQLTLRHSLGIGVSDVNRSWTNQKG